MFCFLNYLLFGVLRSTQVADTCWLESTQNLMADDFRSLCALVCKRGANTANKNIAALSIMKIAVLFAKFTDRGDHLTIDTLIINLLIEKKTV